MEALEEFSVRGRRRPGKVRHSDARRVERGRSRGRNCHNFAAGNVYFLPSYLLGQLIVRGWVRSTLLVTQSTLSVSRGHSRAKCAVQAACAVSPPRTQPCRDACRRVERARAARHGRSWSLGRAVAGAFPNAPNRETIAGPRLTVKPSSGSGPRRAYHRGHTGWCTRFSSTLPAILSETAIEIQVETVKNFRKEMSPGAELAMKVSKWQIFARSSPSTLSPARVSTTVSAGVPGDVRGHRLGRVLGLAFRCWCRSVSGRAGPRRGDPEPAKNTC